MSDDENHALEDARKRPLAERVAHKIWKARVEVYEEMRSKCEKVFSDEDPILNNYGRPQMCLRFTTRASQALIFQKQ